MGIETGTGKSELLERRDEDLRTAEFGKNPFASNAKAASDTAKTRIDSALSQAEFNLAGASFDGGSIDLSSLVEGVEEQTTARHKYLRDNPHETIRIIEETANNVADMFIKRGEGIAPFKELMTDLGIKHIYYGNIYTTKHEFIGDIKQHVYSLTKEKNDEGLQKAMGLCEKLRNAYIEEFLKQSLSSIDYQAYKRASSGTDILCEASCSRALRDLAHERLDNIAD